MLRWMISTKIFKIILPLFFLSCNMNANTGSFWYFLNWYYINIVGLWLHSVEKPVAF